jgi:hypothetical protein
VQQRCYGFMVLLSCCFVEQVAVVGLYASACLPLQCRFTTSTSQRFLSWYNTTYGVSIVPLQ